LFTFNSDHFAHQAEFADAKDFTHGDPLHAVGLNHRPGDADERADYMFFRHRHCCLLALRLPGTWPVPRRDSMPALRKFAGAGMYNTLAHPKWGMLGCSESAQLFRAALAAASRLVQPDFKSHGWTHNVVNIG